MRALFLVAAFAVLLSHRPASAALKLHDERLEASLFAADPEIVTPIGMAIDARNRVFVIESHTHLPPKNYSGPKWDRIKVFVDDDGDGKSDRNWIFAEGFTNAMNLDFAPSGELFVVSSHFVEALRDTDGDGRADERRQLLELKTSNTYSHSALLGIVASPDGWLYVSRGNNGSAAYTLIGNDGSRVSGYGDGGNIVRCRFDGSRLEEFATGFWNPFDLKFDTVGRLLCVDNDPDARGPNRLLHIVRGGDYGYKSIYGGAGNHPFQAWTGELPGTLPMIDGTGEAPSGLIDARRLAFPADYTGSILVTIWNENTITRHVTRPKGTSLLATNSVLISGGQDFRPVAFAADTQGRLFVTDWVLVDYPNHGRGRVWRIQTKSGSERTKNIRETAVLREPKIGENIDAITSALHSVDPFLQHAAVMSLLQPERQKDLESLTKHADAKVRLGAFLAMKRQNINEPTATVRSALCDPAPEIRRLGMIWAGEAGLSTLREDLDRCLEGELSGAEFLTYLAALGCFDSEYQQQLRSRKVDKANQLKRKLPDGLIEGIVKDKKHSARVRSLALTRLDRPERHLATIDNLLDEAPALQIEAVRTLARIPDEQASTLLTKIADDTSRPAQVRAEAIAALSWQGAPEQTNEWLKDENPVVRREAARLLRVEPDDERPETLQGWQAALRSGGDPLAGSRVFFSARTMCSQCHTIENRGGNLGPDLSGIASSVDRASIARSILRPSEEFPPQYQVWFIETKDGELHEGLQLDHKAGGALELTTASGGVQFFPAKVIVRYGTKPRSLMPDGLEQTMTVEEFRDLLAFLETRK